VQLIQGSEEFLGILVMLPAMWPYYIKRARTCTGMLT
jgi:hypothetical protein